MAPSKNVKVPKGTRDAKPDQMVIRERVFRTISDVFKRHGAVSIDTPVFELRETLTGKYGEDSKLIYNLEDQGGEILSLRYDLTVPFARFVAMHGITNIKRYQIGKVYRRDNPAMERGRFREFFQCDFDVAGEYELMVPDAEALKVLTEALDALEMGEYEIKLNHRGLLDAMLAIAGVPEALFRPICSAIDKLDKEPWEKVRREMVEDKKLDPRAADAIEPFVKLRGRPRELLETLRAADGPFASSEQAAKVLGELDVLVGHLEALGALHRIVLDLSLARGLDYYTGVIYEAVLLGAGVGSIAAGGRYDTLVGMFSGRVIPAVGVSIGVERVFGILEARARAAASARGETVRETHTDVLVVSMGSGLQRTRMRIAAALWNANIAAEFGYKPNPKLGVQFTAATKQGIPFLLLVGDSEIEKGTVIIKENREGEGQEEVKLEDM
ncbi:histidyl-tRNA synthetase, partial [Helicosporidium sp. ATCC 50920]